jgi:hypothetical protein
MPASPALYSPSLGSHQPVTSSAPSPERKALGGGVANRGRVFRVGQTVRRPVAPFRAATHAVLDHLASVGFTGSPRVLGHDSNLEVLSYIPGLAARTPLPGWALSDQTLVSVAELLRAFHEAMHDFRPGSAYWPDGAQWPTDEVPAEYTQDPAVLIGHNDIHPGNIVFAHGRAVGLLDFDLAGPGSVVWDLAAAMRCWAPLWSDEDVPPTLAARRFERAALLLDAYGLGGPQRAEVAAALLANHEWTYRIVTAAVERGHPGFSHYWNAVGARALRARHWITANQEELIAAVR